MTKGVDERGPRLAARADAIERSKIRYMFDRAAAIDRELVHLEIGEPDFDTPPHITEAAYQAARDGATHYTSNAGIQPLRNAIAGRAQQLHEYDTDPDTEIVVTAGAMEAIHLAMLAVVNPGDEVVIPEPAWPNYRAQVQLAGGTPIPVCLDSASGFDLDPGRVIDAISSDTAAVLLNSPSNPTGRIYDSQAIADVVDTAAEHDAYVIADEVYARIQFGTFQPAIRAVTDQPEHVLVVDSVSKAYAMTGWRVGWLIGPQAVIDVATKFHESVTACAAAPAQHAALAALEGDQAPVEHMRDAYHDRRDVLCSRIENISGISCRPPDGAIYVFVDVRELGSDSLAVAETLLEEHDLVTAPGSGFGEPGEGFLRLSIANSEANLHAGADALAAFASEAQS